MKDHYRKLKNLTLIMPMQQIISLTLQMMVSGKRQMWVLCVIRLHSRCGRIISEQGLDITDPFENDEDNDEDDDF